MAKSPACADEPRAAARARYGKWFSCIEVISVVDRESIVAAHRPGADEGITFNTQKAASDFRRSGTRAAFALTMFESFLDPGRFEPLVGWVF